MKPIAAASTTSRVASGTPNRSAIVRDSNTTTAKTSPITKSDIGLMTPTLPQITRASHQRVESWGRSQFDFLLLLLKKKKKKEESRRPCGRSGL
ncbi:hypothetical protein GCM10029978_044340 [Actinoallomurus acanthiterrae]